jgi:hypothetical protein
MDRNTNQLVGMLVVAALVAAPPMWPSPAVAMSSSLESLGNFDLEQVHDVLSVYPNRGDVATPSNAHKLLEAAVRCVTVRHGIDTIHRDGDGIEAPPRREKADWCAEDIGAAKCCQIKRRSCIDTTVVDSSFDVGNLLVDPVFKMS